MYMQNAGLIVSVRHKGNDRHLQKHPLGLQLSLHQ
jgi:hypothetical protein